MYLVDGRLQGHKEFVVHDQDKGAAEASDHVGEIALQQKNNKINWDQNLTGKIQKSLNLAYLFRLHKMVL